MPESNNLKIKFITEAGKSFTLNIGYASTELLAEGGDAAVQAVVNYVLQNQPFGITLDSVDSAKFVATTETDITVTAPPTGA